MFPDSAVLYQLYIYSLVRQEWEVNILRERIFILRHMRKAAAVFLHYLLSVLLFYGTEKGFVEGATRARHCGTRYLSY